MSARKNEDRLKAPKSKQSKQPELPPTPEEFKPDDTLTFVTPTEFVEIPSAGRFYPSTHPLHNVDTIEIRHMTAKDEDILASSALLKKGIAIDRLLQSVIVDKKIKIQDLLIGDKNALLIAARVTGYGGEYNASIRCPSCGSTEEHEFDLESLNAITGEDPDEYGASITENGTFIATLPKTGLNVEVRFLNGSDEKYVAQQTKMNKKNNLSDSPLSTQLRRMIVAVNGSRDGASINNLVNNMPAFDSRYLRGLYSKISPNVDMNFNFECSTCSHEQTMEVPLTAEFFWPR